MFKKIVGLTLVIGGIIVGTYVVRDEPAPPPDAPVPATLASGGVFERTELERLIRAYEDRVAENPTALQYTFLGRLYLQQGKFTGDLASYARAAEALQGALDIYPDDVEARTLLATTRYTIHDFDGAAELASTVDDLGARAVVGDASLELGRYDVASSVYDELTQALPGVAAVDARASRLAFLRGDIRSARSFAERAAEEAGAEGAFGPGLGQYHVVLSTLAFERGDYDVAADEAMLALAAADGWHVGLTALGRARAAQGRHDDAIAAYRRAVEAVPEPASVAALGDLLLLRGDKTGAQEQYDTLSVIARLSGGVYDRQLVLFRADHGIVDNDVMLDRGDVYGHDALAWARRGAGVAAGARAESALALALGTRDARLLYHAGMISAALDEPDRAVAELTAALDLNPRFDPIQASRARAMLGELS